MVVEWEANTSMVYLGTSDEMGQFRVLLAWRGIWLIKSSRFPNPNP